MNEDQGGGKSRNPLVQKFGPLPVWAWLGLITVVLLGYWLYSSKKKKTASNPVVVASESVGGGGTTQAATPTPETGLTAAQEKELATLPGQLAAQEKDEETDEAKYKDEIADLQGRGKKKPPPRRRRRAGANAAATHGATAHPSAVKAA